MAGDDDATRRNVVVDASRMQYNKETNIAIVQAASLRKRV
jgi:hypothetical protein